MVPCKILGEDNPEVKMEKAMQSYLPIANVKQRFSAVQSKKFCWVMVIFFSFLDYLYQLVEERAALIKYLMLRGACQ